MTYSRARVQGQRSVGSEDKQADGQTKRRFIDGQSDGMPTRDSNGPVADKSTRRLDKTPTARDKDRQQHLGGGYVSSSSPPFRFLPDR